MEGTEIVVDEWRVRVLHWSCGGDEYYSSAFVVLVTGVEREKLSRRAIYCNLLKLRAFNRECNVFN